jgi:hypothetical protein
MSLIEAEETQRKMDILESKSGEEVLLEFVLNNETVFIIHTSSETLYKGTDPVIFRNIFNAVCAEKGVRMHDGRQKYLTDGTIIITAIFFAVDADEERIWQRTAVIYGEPLLLRVKKIINSI